MVLLDKQIKTKRPPTKMETRIPSDTRIYIFSMAETKGNFKRNLSRRHDSVEMSYYQIRFKRVGARSQWICHQKNICETLNRSRTSRRSMEIQSVFLVGESYGQGDLVGHSP